MFCGMETIDSKGTLHRCGLPVNEGKLTPHPVHVCGLPFMELPLDRVGTCLYNWMDK